MHLRVEVKQQLENCLRALDEGTLTEAELRSVLTTLDAAPPRQQLLFLRTAEPTVDSGVVGTLLLDHGQLQEGPEKPRRLALSFRHRCHPGRLTGNQVPGTFTGNR